MQSIFYLTISYFKNSDYNVPPEVCNKAKFQAPSYSGSAPYETAYVIKSFVSFIENEKFEKQRA